MKTIILGLLSLSLMATSCNKSSEPSLPVNTEGQPIVSDQFTDDKLVFPDGVRRFVSLIQLKTPALLETAKVLANGKVELNESQKALVLEEQEALKEKLADISADIKVLYEYRLVLNGLAIEAPQEFSTEISQLDVQFIEADERFALPQVTESKTNSLSSNLAENNSMTFIGATKVHQSTIIDPISGKEVAHKGKGVKIGIIDSGIDYTHKMFGGPGTTQAFLAVNPKKDSPLFPSKKVVGGYDFAGDYNPSSHLYSDRIPNPDSNPIDQTGHGTHVAGTAAGLGDNVQTYDGAAPEADLFALKVFGDSGGGTSDTIVIAALEFAMDPNKDFNLEDKLDVLNVSLGGGFGKPHSLYGKAIGNLTKGGILAVASAGNSGPVNSIVGAPSTSENALSVAASLDSTYHLWNFPAVKFIMASNPTLLFDRVEGSISKPISEAGNIQGELVAVGTLAEELSAEVSKNLNGKIALVDRGDKVPFSEKFKKVIAAGAIGVVMVNDREDPLVIPMGGEGEFDIPGVMVPKAMGDIVKKEMTKNSVQFEFAPTETIQRPELIDTMAGFSSQGPRDLDALIKPEVTAPGEAIISARIGSGDKPVQLGGTSMSAPHITGIAALLVQKHPQLSPLEIKSLIMNSGKLIGDTNKNVYSISRQGAGRTRVDMATNMELVFSKPAISLGKVSTSTATSLTDSFEVKNISDTPVEYTLSVKSGDNIQISLSQETFNLAPGENVEVDLVANLSIPSVEFVELDAFIEIKKDSTVMGYIPVMAVINRSTQISLTSLEAVGSDNDVSLTLTNSSQQEGRALLFNLLGTDSRKKETNNPFLSVACDLQSAGYRVITRDNLKILQIAAKLYNPVTTWSACDLNVDIDVDNDQKADFDIAGTTASAISGLRELEVPGLASVLFDSKKAGDIYDKYLQEVAKQEEEGPSLNFLPSVVKISPMASFNHSTVAVVEVPLESLGNPKAVQLIVSTAYNGRDIVERTDRLGEGSGTWNKASLDTDVGFFNIPEVVDIPAQGTINVPMDKGTKNEALVAYFPRNDFILETLGLDSQSQVMKLEASTPIPLK